MRAHVGCTRGRVNGQVKSAVANAGRFLLHFMEMALAMIVGLEIFSVIGGKPPEANVILWYAGMQLSIIPPVTALLLSEHHGWRSSLEMAGTLLIVPTIVLSCAQFGWNNLIPGLSRDTLLQFSDPKMMVLGMFFAMLPRRKMFTKPLVAHQHSAR